MGDTSQLPIERVATWVFLVKNSLCLILTALTCVYLFRRRREFNTPKKVSLQLALFMVCYTIKVVIRALQLDNWECWGYDLTIDNFANVLYDVIHMLFVSEYLKLALVVPIILGHHPDKAASIKRQSKTVLHF